MIKYAIYFFLFIFTYPIHSDELKEVESETPPQSRAALSSEKIEAALEKNLATLGGEPSAIVHGHVNAVTGTFIDSAIDLCVPGPDLLFVERLYTNTTGWFINDAEKVEIRRASDPIVTYSSKGMVSTFSEHGDIHKIRSENYRKGLTNCSSEFMSGRNNPHNLQMEVKSVNHSYDLENYHCTLKDGTKSVKKFEKRFSISHPKKKPGESLLTFAYGLIFEQKSHGIRTLYDYQNSRHGFVIKEKSNINGAGQILNSIKFDYSENFIKNPRLVAHGNNKISGQCEYIFDSSNCSLLKQVLPSTAPVTLYEYHPKTGFMTRKIQPESRLLQVDYYDEVNPYVTVKDKAHVQYGRVFTLRAPVGKNADLHTTHRFFYEIHKEKRPNRFDVTHVFDIYNQETRYSYDGDTHLRKIEELGSDSRTYGFFWYEKDTKNDGNLKTKTLQDSSGNIVSCRHYIYDKKGNITQNVLLGNLTGKTIAHLQLDGAGVPNIHENEAYIIRCEYSDDGYNHLLREEDGRKIIEYVYIPRTDFLAARYIKDLSGQIRYREFFEYNINGSITKKTFDDGCLPNKENLTGVTERHIIAIHYRNQLPIGLPEVIEEKYLDLKTHTEKSLSKIVQFHDNYGQIVQQDHYDANGKFRYSLKWEFDAHGNVIKEIDPQGEASTYSYDANDNLITEQHPGNSFYTRHQYDYCNRLISSEDVHPTFTLVTSHDYNFLSQKIATVDWYGQETNFTYDRLGRVTSKTYPTIFNEDGTFYRPKESVEYDVADNPIRKMDSRGNVTNITYNIRGQPCDIYYADGATEHHEYSLDGLLEKKVALNGSITTIEYDYLGRPQKNKIYAPDGTLLLESSSEYSYFHKLIDTDPEGHQTNYQYDHAGRVICVTKGNAKTCYQYDACQRISRILEYFGPGEQDYIAKVQDYDIMDRIIEERTEDPKGTALTKVRYVYNSRGERIQTINYHQSSPAITSVEYNAYGEIEKWIDPEGNTTLTKFFYDYINHYGQRVFAQEVIDPLGNFYFIEKDPLGRIKFEIRKDAMGLIIQKRELCYDAAGNCIRQIDHAFATDQSSRQVEHHFEYDSNNHLIVWIEAVGTPEQRQTSFIYNAYRQKTTVVKPNGIELKHEYDWLGRLNTFKASDDSFHYQYAYDANFNVLCVNDCKNGTSTQRTFDSNNRMAQEVLENGLSVDYTYDCLGRTTQLTLPDKTTIGYQYDFLHLKQVQRGDYIHSYRKYNLSGLLEKAEMIGKAGKVQYTIDACHRLINVSTPSWQEQIPSGGFDKAGNLIRKETKDALGSVHGNFSYNSLYQLTLEKGVTTHHFLYDSLYNLIQKDDHTHEINSLNQLLNDGFESCVYDSNGNLVQKGSLRLSYDALDRLITVVDGYKATNYTYDELNRRMSSTYYINQEKQKTLKYIYQGQNEIGAVDESGKIVELRVLGLGKGAEIAAAVLLELDGMTYAPVHDICGNVCALVDPKDGKTVEVYRYSAYGEEELYDAKDNSLDSTNNPWRFCSKRTDSETAFVNFGHRYYNPKTTRWVTTDPLGLEAGPNLYTYLFNNPINQFDLYGLEKCYGEEKFSHTYCLNESWYENRTERKTASLLDHEKSTNSQTKQSNSGQHSHYRLAHKGTESGRNFVYINGVGVSVEEAEKNCLDIFNKNGSKYDVYLCYNASHGFVLDTLECIAQFVGIETHSTQVFKECMKVATMEVGENGVTCLIAHSQGALIAFDGSRTLSESVTSKVSAYTLASPVALPEGTYGRVTNEAAGFDVISWWTRGYNSLKAGFGGTHAPINILESRGPIFRYHDFNGKTYRMAREQFIEKILE